MRKCEICGKEGGVPDVRGCSSFAAQVGNFRLSVNGKMVVCEECANKAMNRALVELMLALGWTTGDEKEQS